MAAERDATLRDEYKLKFEYGFREKAKAAKLRGGKGPKERREKKEKRMINVGGGGGGHGDPKKKKVKSKRPKMINVNDKDGEEEVVEEKKVVSKMDLGALLAGPSNASGGAAPISLADRMKMLQKGKDPEQLKKEAE